MGRKNSWKVAVLEILQTSEQPMSAYEILGKLRDKNPKIAPPTIYRTLSDLVERGRAHRLDHDFGESRKASAAKGRHKHELNIFH